MINNIFKSFLYFLGWIVNLVLGFVILTTLLTAILLVMPLLLILLFCAIIYWICTKCGLIEESETEDEISEGSRLEQLENDLKNDVN